MDEQRHRRRAERLVECDGREDRRPELAVRPGEDRASAALVRPRSQEALGPGRFVARVGGEDAPGALVLAPDAGG